MKRIIFVLTAAALVSGCGIFGGGGDKKRTPVLGERLPILVYEANAEPDPELADVTIVLPAPRTNEEWTQPGGNASKKDRKSVVSGKSVSVRVELGGRRTLKKKRK